MKAVNHILVPTDGSEDACKAAAFAGGLARALKARVSLLLVLPEDSILHNAWGVGAESDVEEIRNMLEKQARENELPKTIESLGDLDVKPELITSWGHPADEISRFAREHKVDLIVVGSHGRTGIKRAFLGSVSQAVANQAPCAVTIVK
ncbi:MAG: universal stress protein [Gammaproteobacteria bacterium]|nr:universal stress protein [Gammaproteobacteria bacterium]